MEAGSQPLNYPIVGLPLKSRKDLVLDYAVKRPAYVGRRRSILLRA